MKTTTKTSAALAMAALLAAALPALAQEDDAPVHHRRHVRTAANEYGDTSDRPLTIGRNRRHAHSGVIQISPYEVYAPGGFPYRGPRPNFAQREELRRADKNEAIREETDGVYGYGFDGLGGTGAYGFSNPNYGNSYNRYTGYNGVPSNFAFGPSYAFRHITDHDADDDEDAEGNPIKTDPYPAFPPAPGEKAAPIETDDDDF